MKSPTSFAPGQQVARYTIRKLLAQGGMAEVYKADQELTAGIFRPVALKVIRPEYSGSPDFREMFLDEARCACGLSHPNIVHIFDVGEAEGLLYMAMELVPGETLATVNRTLREHQDKFTDEALYAIGIYCAGALDAVHSLRLEESHVNLVHRDVSPHNLLLSSRGSLKLIDFGIAKAATNRNLTSPGVTKGKAGYFSPEQAMGKALDGRSDLFSLGVTLYKLAYGATPFDHHTSHSERNGALVRGLWKSLEEVQPGLSPGLYDVIGKAMKLKPDDRYANAGAMREALEQAAFAAGVRIGASSLLGYVTDDGEITAVPTGSRTPSIQAVQDTRIADTRIAEVTRAAAKATPLDRPKLVVPQVPMTRTNAQSERERVTDRVMERPRSSRRPLVMVAAFGAAVVLGLGISAAFIFGTDEAVVPPAQPIEPALVKVVPPTPPPPTPTPVPEPTPAPVDVQPDSEPQVQLEPVVEVKPPAPTPAPVRPRHPKPQPKGEPAQSAEAIPQGEGQLRITTQPSSVASRVTVDRSDWGSAPVNRRVASGRYAVSVLLPDGKKSPEWRGPVMPDTTTVLIYDIESGRWSKR